MGAPRKSGRPRSNACSSLDLVRAVAVGVHAVTCRVGGVFTLRANRIGGVVGILDDVFSNGVGVRFNRVSRILGIRFDIVGGLLFGSVVAGSERTDTEGNGQRG